MAKNKEKEIWNKYAGESEKNMNAGDDDDNDDAADSKLNGVKERNIMAKGNRRIKGGE